MNNDTKFQFMLLSSNDSSKHELGEDMLVGREIECQIHLNSPQISRYHAKLYLKNNNLFVRDLHSSNGTFVNGKRVIEETQLNVGDEITFHDQRFRLASTASGSVDATVVQASADNATRIMPKNTIASGLSQRDPHDLLSNSQIPNISEHPTPVQGIKENYSDEQVESLDEWLNQAKQTPKSTSNQIESKPIQADEQEDDMSTRILSAGQILNVSQLNASVLNDESIGPRLICLTAPIRGKSFPLKTDEPVYTWTIGRNEFVEIEISSQSASRMHAWITKMESIYEIAEENATNGLIVNGEKTSKAILRHEDIIQIGNVSLLFRNNGEEEYPLGWWDLFVVKTKKLINKLRQNLWK